MGKFIDKVMVHLNETFPDVQWTNEIVQVTREGRKRRCTVVVGRIGLNEKAISLGVAPASRSLKYTLDTIGIHVANPLLEEKHEKANKI